MQLELSLKKIISKDHTGKEDKGEGRGGKFKYDIFYELL
jgi:hypothetical protein